MPNHRSVGNSLCNFAIIYVHIISDLPNQ
jgi:hypothetical protein